MIGTFFLGALSALHDVVRPLRWLSPHKIVDPIQTFMQGFEWTRVAL